MHSLLRTLKHLFYFKVASYFCFFALIYLKKWNPTIVVITGSSGKTTFLHLVEAQLGKKARYSHQANSAFGIPFHILGLKRNSYTLNEWILLIIKAPLQVFKKVYNEKLYIVEVDADRPGEGALIASLLRPHVVIWLSLGQAHGANYDKLVSEGLFSGVHQAIAFEYGYLIAQAQSLVIANGDNEFIIEQLARTHVEKHLVEKIKASNYLLKHQSTEFDIDQIAYTLPALLPRDSAYALKAIDILLKYLGKEVDESYSRFVLPPGRSSVFEGIRHTTLIDSSYSATIEGMRAVLDMIEYYPAKTKWLVLGDMLEQGVNEIEEHQTLADIIIASGAQRVVLIGPRLIKNTYPLLTATFDKNHIATFSMPAAALEYLHKEIQGGEVILFKGARFLEGIVEQLLFHKEDAVKLCRREAVWVKRRKQWGL